MKLIVGLGNPGEQYKNTRHNVGFMVVETLAEELACPKFGMEQKLKSEIVGAKAKTSAGQVEPMLLVKPQTYMNQSGEAVGLVLNYYKDRLTLEDLWVVHDDVDLKLGQIKVQRGGGSGGHHGIESIAGVVGTSFVRFRLGIGRPKEKKYDVYNYVLETIKETEMETFSEMVKRATQVIRLAIESGLEVAMNKYNSK
jgi:PTH1 family peptidyl-tRNA hydrolase